MSAPEARNGRCNSGSGDAGLEERSVVQNVHASHTEGSSDAATTSECAETGFRPHEKACHATQTAVHGSDISSIWITAE